MSGTAPTDRLTPVDDRAGRTIYYHDRRGTYHVWCDATDYEPASTAVLVAISSVLGVDPGELDPLSERIDPDALNALVASWHRADADPPERAITFPFAACDVTVRADGEIVVDPADSERVADR